MVWVRAVGVLLLVCLLVTGATAGSRDDPEIEDPEGDNLFGWLDIRSVWVEEAGFDVVKIWLEVAETIPFAPNQGTGGMFNGPYWYVYFDLVDWNGTRIGNRDNQHVSIRIEELITITYICVWDQYDYPCEAGFTCCYGPLARIVGPYIIWELDFKKPMGENWTVGSGFRLENLTASAGLRTLAYSHSAVTDWAPDEGFGRDFVSPPRIYENVRTHDGGLVFVEGGYVAAGVLVLAGILAGIGRLAYKAGRYTVLQWILLGFLFSRLERDAVLENQRRAALVGAIHGKPGITFSELRRQLRIGSGALVHHLRVLEKQGFVRCVPEGFRSHFYARGTPVTPRSYVSRTQRSVLAAVEKNPGITQHQLAKIVGLPRQSLRYHTHRMLERGLVDVRKDGKWRRHYVA